METLKIHFHVLFFPPAPHPEKPSLGRLSYSLMKYEFQQVFPDLKFLLSYLTVPVSVSPPCWDLLTLGFQWES